ncbi:CapA family protein [Nocardia vaccinii]|uniref:CapA family protein n=1 Tax=Nocardia vaccinii TaxID=1822 RepID=UPI00083354A9|nr:CapA family protein [Nocardia vaccinii]
MTSPPVQPGPVLLALAGDVMLGRGIDQVLAHPVDPELREPCVDDARRYVELAEQASGPIPRPVAPAWPWGEVSAMLGHLDIGARVINLETAITADGEFARGKGIHYRISPRNIAALSAGRPDVCVLANNHVLDFGPRGLYDTLTALADAGIATAGAGLTRDHAYRPAVVDLDDGRHVIVAAVAAASSGVPGSWAAQPRRPGVWRIDDLSSPAASDQVAAIVSAHKRAGDVAVVSVHWGPNWGYGVADSEMVFAHRLIDAGIDVVHGHSCHHPRPLEFYRGRPILYGCGDLINDYEGIRGYQWYHPDLHLLFVVSVAPGGDSGVRMLPLRIRRMRLEPAGAAEAEWLCATMDHISRPFHTGIVAGPDGLLVAEHTRGLFAGHFARSTSPPHAHE